MVTLIWTSQARVDIRICTMFITKRRILMMSGSQMTAIFVCGGKGGLDVPCTLDVSFVMSLIVS